MGDQTMADSDAEMRLVTDATDGGKRTDDKKANLKSDAENTTPDIKGQSEINGEVRDVPRPRGRPKKIRVDENIDKNEGKRTRKRGFSESDEEAGFLGFESHTIIYPGLEIINKLLADMKNVSPLPTKRIRRPTVKVLENADTEASENRSRHLVETENTNAQKQETDHESDIDAGPVNESSDHEIEQREDSTLITTPNPTPGRRGRRSSAAYKKPFDIGWKREVATRATSENSQVKNEKVTNISTENSKEQIGMKKPLEIIRDNKLQQENSAVHKSSASTSTKEEVDTPVKNDTPVQKKVAAKRGRPRLNPKAEPVTPSAENDLTPTSPKSKPKEVQNDVQTPKKVTRKEGVKGSPMTRRSQQNQQLTPQVSDAEQMDSASTSEDLQSPVSEKTIKTNKRLKRKKTPQVEVDFRRYNIANACAYYDAFPRVFQYLKVQELLRASRVCKMWRDLVAHPSLWRTVRMKNSQVTDWEGFAEALNRYQTQHLDLRKILMPEGENIWAKFIEVLPKIKSLKKLELCRCPGNVVEAVIQNCPQLETFHAMSIKCDSLDMGDISKFVNCKELRLKAIACGHSMTLSNSLKPLCALTQLIHLSLTSVKELGKKDIHLVKDLINLEVLELGECSDLPGNFGTDVIVNLPKLERLRLEKGQGDCYTFNILEGVSQSPNLTQLELVNFDIKKGFDSWLAKCKNIKRLLIIPTYISQSATSNHMILGGVTQLKNTLMTFIWGVTLELLRVTDLFVDQCSILKKRIKGDAIPVLKPIPCAELIEDILKDAVKNAENSELAEMERKNSDIQANAENLPEVDILTLLQLQKLLIVALPDTRVKILKIPFHATWRQSLLDSVMQ